VAITCRWNL